MDNLEEFLTLPDVSDIEAEVIISKRFGKFKIKALSCDEYEAIVKKARKMNIKTKKIDFDTNMFNSDVINCSLISPDFSNKEFLDKVKCNTAREFINKKLLPGEIQELSDKIVELSGFDKELPDQIDEAKN